MIVYNITIKISPQVEEEWIAWQKSVHIPEVMATGYFTSFKFFRLLEQKEEDGGTYVVQYFADSLEQYQKYIHGHAAVLRQKAQDKWGDKFIAFRTIMELVN